MVSIIGLKKASIGCMWVWTVVYPTGKVVDYRTNWYGEGIYEVSPRVCQVEGDCDFLMRGIATYNGVYKKLRRRFEA